MTRHDVVFLGTSPNALVCAARLARSGLSVLLLETRGAPGGPLATEPFAPGFLADTGVMSAAIDAEIASDLGLSLEVIARDTVTSLGPAPVTLARGPEAFPHQTFAWPAPFQNAVQLLRALHAESPPSMPVPSPGDMASLNALSAHLQGLGPRGMHEVLRLLFLPMRDYLREIQAPPALQGMLAGLGVRGLSEGPFAAGTLYNALHHEATGDGLFRATVRGGPGKLAETLADKALATGAQIRFNVPVPLHIQVEDGIARAVRLPTGERLTAGAFVSDHDARFTFTRLVSPTDLDPETNRAIRHLRYRGSVARVHLALRALPEFPGVDPRALGGSLVVAPGVDSLERAWDQAKRGTVSSEPYLEAAIPTVRDDSLAPQGRHILSVWAQYVPFARADRNAVAKIVTDRLASFAPGLPSLVLASQVLLPEDLEARFHLTEGQIYGGENRLEQSFFLRPLPGLPRYGSPIENLYLTGSGAHPAGYGGRSGWNLARLLLEGGPGAVAQA